MSEKMNRLRGEGIAQPEITNPRELRLLAGLLQRAMSRETLDRAVGCSNGPDIVMRLRNRDNFDLPCSRVSGRDRDGNSVKFGVYSATPADKHRIRELLRGGI